MKKLLAAAAVCGLFLSGGALRAAEGDKPKPDPEQQFKRLDANADGKVTKEEFLAKAKDKAKAETRFGKLDKNADGSLTLEEFKAGSEPKKPKAPK